jgi:FAD/FMN-containing dehydrogenase
VFAGTFIYRRERWADALRGWDAWVADVPDPMTSIATFLVPRPDFGLGDDPIMLIAWLWASPDRAGGERVADRLRAVVPPDEAVVQPTRWTAWQSQADSLFPKGVRSYWRNTSFDRLDSATIGVIVDRALEQTWPDTGFDIHQMGGAFGRVSLGDTPFPNRSARYWLNIYGFWRDPTDDADRIAFVRGFAADMEPLASAGRYVNFLGAEDDRADPGAAALAVFGPDKLARLTAVKRRYDPDNVFRLNHNIPPG